MSQSGSSSRHSFLSDDQSEACCACLGLNLLSVFVQLRTRSCSSGKMVQFFVMNDYNGAICRKLTICFDVRKALLESQVECRAGVFWCILAGTSMGDQSEVLRHENCFPVVPYSEVKADGLAWHTERMGAGRKLALTLFCHPAVQSFPSCNVCYVLTNLYKNSRWGTPGSRRSQVLSWPFR